MILTLIDNELLTLRKKIRKLEQAQDKLRRLRKETIATAPPIMPSERMNYRSTDTHGSHMGISAAEDQTFYRFFNEWKDCTHCNVPSSHGLIKCRIMRNAYAGYVILTQEE